MDRIARAVVFAALSHAGQRRKGTMVPYIVHPCTVALRLQRYGAEEDVIIAGVLHDVVEDAGVSLDAIRHEFGDRVAELVAAVSEQKRSADGEIPWETRKRVALARLPAAGPSAALIKAADALDNIWTICADLERVGPDVWARFKRGRESQLWLYRQTLAVCRAILGDHQIIRDLEAAVNRLDQIARP
jgi:(p)ppGpp synthase/HD superfamily hydrolase